MGFLGTEKTLGGRFPLGGKHIHWVSTLSGSVYFIKWQLPICNFEKHNILYYSKCLISMCEIERNELIAYFMDALSSFSCFCGPDFYYVTLASLKLAILPAYHPPP